jgi:hypothetical protein
MLNFRSITTLLNFLLISTLVTSCDCGNKKEQEKKQLVAEEKKLIGDQVKILIKWFNASPTLEEEKEALEQLQTKYQEIKDKSSVESIEMNIKEMEAIKDILESGNDSNIQEELSKIDQFIIDEDYSTFINTSQSNISPLSLILDITKEFVSNMLFLYKNIKRQVELKK